MKTKKSRTKPKANSFTDNDKRDLIKELSDFTSWLKQREIVKEDIVTPTRTVDFPYSDDNYVMQVDDDKVSFNTFIRNKCSLEYYRIVVLHEFFHLTIQKVPNKDDVTKIKDDFGSGFMKLIDIEADFFIALYLKEVKNYTLVDYWRVNHEGGTVFVDKWVRAIKFERFIGTLLSICKMFLTYPDKTDRVIEYDLYLPTIAPIYTEDSLHVLVIRKEHIYFDEIKATYRDFAKLKECYEDVSKYSISGYVKELIGFSTKALKKEIPKEMKLEIANLQKSGK